MNLVRFLLVSLLAPLVFAKSVVVTTTTILGDLTQHIGGDAIETVSLLAPGVDPHAYDPTPDDVRRLATAQLVVVNGLGFETWAGKLIENSGFKGTVVTASTGVTALHFEEAEAHGQAHDDHAGHDHGHGAEAIDPHAWHDLRNIRYYVGNIRDALCQLEPAQAEQFRQRADSYLAQVDQLHAEASATFATIPAAQRKLVTSHDALRYLGNAYGLTIVPIAGLSPDREPSARQLANIVKFIRQQKVRAVFIEATSNPKIPQLIANEAHVTVVDELYTDSLGEKGSPGATFLGMFRYNLATITKALK